MNSADDVFRQIESDREMREREVRLIGNMARRTASQSEREALFRSAVLLTYAHLEGFCKFALLAYAAALNRMRLRCRDASFVVVAASMSKVFSALRNPQSKHTAFARALPDDAKLHLLARESEFVERFAELVETVVDLPDDVVDTESNLSSIVLKKNLFRLGLNYPIVEAQEANLNKLLGIRNAIAHGDSLRIPKQQELEGYTDLTFRMMSFVQLEIHKALTERIYLRAKDEA